MADLQDRNRQRLEKHYAAVGWILDHYDLIKTELRNIHNKTPDGTFIPFDVLEYLLSLAQSDLADLLTLIKSEPIIEKIENG